MPLQKLPTSDLDNQNHRKRAREVLNQVLDHSFDDSRRQTPAEKLAGVTPINKAYPPGDIRRYGADETGSEDSAPAINQAILANSLIYIPAGSFLIASTIVVTGNKVITGPSSGTVSNQTAALIDSIPAGSVVRADTAQAGTETTITLDASASAVDDAYNYMLIRITGGTGSGQWVGISDYVGATKVATIDRSWTTTPDNSSTFEITNPSHLFQDTGGNFGGVYIGNFAVSGGDSTGSFCVYSTRPQSVIEGIHMEGTTGYAKNGVAIVDGSASGDGSWDTSIHRCKWVGPATTTNYRGYLVNVDGGNVDLCRLTAIRGSVGIEVSKCEALRIHKVNMNLQSSDYSSESTSKGQCCIRLTGTNSKKAVKIDTAYLEGSSTALWVESLEAGSLTDTFVDDLGNGGLPQVKLASSDSKNLTIKSCDIRSRSAGGKCIENAGSNTLIIGSKLLADGSAASIPLDNTGTNLVTINNRLTADVAGVALKTTTAMVELGNSIVSGSRSDTNGVIQDIFPSETSFTAVVSGDGTAGTYEIASQSCSMTFQGRRAWVDIDITMAAALTGGGTGNLVITGIPITKRNGVLPMGSAVFGGIDWTGNYVNVGFSSGGTSTTLIFYQTTDNGAISFIPISGIAANDTIRCSLSFRT